MQCILSVLLLLVSLVNTQQPSKCNMPILGNNYGSFVDFNFPQKHNNIMFTTTPNPSSINSTFGQEIGSVWELSKLTNAIKIEFSTPILISSFAINSYATQGNNRITTNQILKLDYQSPNSDTYTRLKPFHFPDGFLEFSENNGLPTIFVFDQILTDQLLVSITPFVLHKY